MSEEATAPRQTQRPAPGSTAVLENFEFKGNFRNGLRKFAYNFLLGADSGLLGFLQCSAKDG